MGIIFWNFLRFFFLDKNIKKKKSRFFYVVKMEKYIQKENQKKNPEKNPKKYPQKKSGFFRIFLDRRSLIVFM